MSLVFIFSGLILLANIFGIMKFKSIFNRNVFMIMTLFICLSFFMGDIVVLNVVINLFALIAFALLMIYALNKFSLNICYPIFAVCIIYLLIVDNSLDYLISFDASFAMVLILIFSLKYLGDIKAGVIFVLITSFLLSIVSVYMSIDNFGYGSLDILFSFKTTLIFVLVHSIYKSIRYLMIQSNKEVYFYEKKFACSISYVC